MKRPSGAQTMQRRTKKKSRAKLREKKNLRAKLGFHPNPNPRQGCACAISHGSRWRQRPGHHIKPRKNGNLNSRPRTEKWPRQTASGDLGVLLQLRSLNRLASPLTGSMIVCAPKNNRMDVNKIQNQA